MGWARVGATVLIVISTYKAPQTAVSTGRAASSASRTAYPPRSFNTPTIRAQSQPRPPLLQSTDDASIA